MSKYVPFVVSPQAITLTIDSQTIVVNTSNKHHNDIIEALKSQDWQKVRDLADVVKRLEMESEGLFTINSDNVVCVGDEAVPQVIQDRIMQFSAQGLPYEPIKKFWDNLKENPSFRARKDLFSFLEHNGHPITEDGCFIAYKRVRDDFKDVHSGKFDNTPGSVISMPRDKVDDDPTKTCSSGLHVANREYATNFYGGGRLIYCKVNPKDVVAIPIDYNNQKMRCCCYEVLSEDEGERREALFTGDSRSGSWSSEFNDGFDAGLELGMSDGEESIITRNVDKYIESYYPGSSDDFKNGFKDGYADGLETSTDEDEDDSYDSYGDEEEEDTDYDDGYDAGLNLSSSDHHEGITSRDVFKYISINYNDRSEQFNNGFDSGYSDGVEDRF